MSSKQAMVRTIETRACLFSTGNHYLYIYTFLTFIAHLSQGSGDLVG